MISMIRFFCHPNNFFLHASFINYKAQSLVRTEENERLMILFLSWR